MMRQARWVVFILNMMKRMVIIVMRMRIMIMMMRQARWVVFIFSLADVNNY